VPGWVRQLLLLFSVPRTLESVAAELPRTDVSRLWQLLIGKGILERVLD
jgi:hypothetical protein